MHNVPVDTCPHRKIRMKPTQSKYKQRQKDKLTKSNEIKRNPQISHTKIQNPQTNPHNSIDILLLQNSATPNRRENTLTYQNIKNLNTTHRQHRHLSLTVAALALWLIFTQPRKSPVRVCPNKGRKELLLVGLSEKRKNKVYVSDVKNKFGPSVGRCKI